MICARARTVVTGIRMTPFAIQLMDGIGRIAASQVTARHLDQKRRRVLEALNLKRLHQQ